MTLLIILLVVLALLLALGVFRLTRPRSIIWQWGEEVKVRPGSPAHDEFEDEPEEVPYVDYKYWVRLKPNPGINLPVVGYWSKAYGRKDK